MSTAEYHPKAIGIQSDDTVVINTGFFPPEATFDQRSVYCAIDMFCENMGSLDSLDYLRTFSPSESVLPHTTEDIKHHLRDHSAHVLVLSYLYMKKLQSLGIVTLTDDEFESVLWASVYHDAMRKNDAEDSEHGNAVAHAIEMDGEHVFGIPERLKPLVCTIIREHVPDDNADMHKLSRIFKDVDNMLWIRTGDFDFSYIRNPVAYDLLPIAHALLKQTESESQNHQDLFEAGLSAAVSIGIPFHS